jgi:hypothetical protein
MRQYSLPLLYQLLAPRPLALQVGAQDWSFPWESTLGVLEVIRQVYATQGADNRLLIEVLPGGHAYQASEQVLTFLSQAGTP